MRKSLVAALLFFVSAVTLLAHPHIFIDYTVTVLFDEIGINGIRTEWVFDEMFSAATIGNYDADKDGTLNTQEMQNIKNDVFNNIRHYNYFLYLVERGKHYEVKKIEDFSAAIENNRLVYRFLIPLRIKAKRSRKALTLAFYDESYYVSLRLREYDPLKFESKEGISYSYDLKDEYADGDYYGQGPRQEIWLKFQKD